MLLPEWTINKLDELAEFYEGSTHMENGVLRIYVPYESAVDMRGEVESFARIAAIDARVLGCGNMLAIELHLGDNPNTVRVI